MEENESAEENGSNLETFHSDQVPIPNNMSHSKVPVINSMSNSKDFKSIKTKDTSEDEYCTQSMFSSYCREFLGCTDMNQADPEVMNFLRFLYMEGVENSIHNMNAVPVDCLKSNELEHKIYSFYKDVQNGKTASDLHASIYIFLTYLIGQYLSGRIQSENSCEDEVCRNLNLISNNELDNAISILNRNNHKIICVPTMKRLRDEMRRVIDENFCLSSENYLLRNRIRLQKKKAMCECNKILQAIIRYCEDQLECSWKCKCDPCPIGQSRIGAGCSTGGCGGYTPSGWNKLMTKARLLCDEKQCGCCSPTCTCTECLCTAVRRKPKCRRNLCTDFCNSQTSPEDESASNNKNRPSLKLLGELAFQLERRILDYVFGMEDSKRRRFYGYTVSNIFSMMEKESKSPKGGSDVITKSELAGRLKTLLTALEKYGYNIKMHAEFAQEMVNKYGLLSCPPDESTIEQFGLNDASSIACLIQQLAQGPSEISNFNILLNCLKYLSKCDKRPLFMW